jgi:uncharacterized protein YacL
MIAPFTATTDEDPKSLWAITIESLVFGLVGIIIGTIINNEFIKLSNDQSKGVRYLLSVLQILFSGFIIAVMYMYMSSYFTDHFQRTLSGLAFPALFYSVQSNIYTVWQE